MTAPEALYIDGKWIKGRGREFVSTNPASGEILWQAPAAGPLDIERARQAARTAFPLWSATSFDQRIKYLEAFRQIMELDKAAFSEIISKETGKPLWESLGEVGSMITKVDISIQAYKQRCAEEIKNHPSGRLATRFKPHGVIVVLGPFNFPGHLPNGHIIPALLAGNTIIFKPSEFTPLVGQKMVTYWEQAGLPPGVLNLLQGGGDLGKALSLNPDIDGLFFTGSYSTGKLLSEHFGKHPEKILALELGGNNPLVVSQISDLLAAVYQTIQSAFLTSGQRCSCARRLIVLESKSGDQFIEALTAAIGNIKIGPYTDKPEPFMGPVISEAAMVRLLSHQASLLAKGAKSLVELKELQEKAWLVSPGLIDITHVHDVPDVEVFGPFLHVIRVKDFSAAIVEANRTHYGLAAGLFSNDEKEYTQFYQQVKAGVINWNTPLTGASSAAPFGGIGWSGNHRPSAYLAADYCAYPTASLESPQLRMPATLVPGIHLPAKAKR